MRVLVIDSHKGSERETPQNLHWRNARMIASSLNADLIWSYPSVNDNIKAGYDVIIFVHASPYCYIDKAWLDRSPDAELFYVTNEYNLGEPRILWKPAKAGRHYTVIANHYPDVSKIVKKYTKAWHRVNLNALSYSLRENIACFQSDKVIYFGGYRRDREPSYIKYLTGNVLVSTHRKNEERFRQLGCRADYVNRLNWHTTGLRPYKASLYLEDETTHDSYNYLANRFYEALNYQIPTVFAAECGNTIRESGYNVPSHLIVESPESLASLFNERPFEYAHYPLEWHKQAYEERCEALRSIRQITKHENRLHIPKDCAVALPQDARNQLDYL